MWIGLDDTDSKDGGCTTHICFEFVCRLYDHGYGLCNYPRLIRLNPQVPWKTRGNGAIAIHIGKPSRKQGLFGNIAGQSLYFDSQASTSDIDRDFVQDLLQGVLDEFAEMDAENTNPAFVIVSAPFSNSFYKKAVHELVSIKEAVSLISKENGSYTLLKNGRGVIGATAAISWDNKQDHTYEIICYRKKKKWKSLRRVDEDSVKKMDALFPSTFDNYDYNNHYNCIVPHSPCPILFGIRGDDPEVLPACAKQIESESMAGWMLFVSNQGTDDHIRQKVITQIASFQSIKIKGMVASMPVRKRGGHVFFLLKDAAGDSIDCAAYEPTKEFRTIIEDLIIGDMIEVYGGIREKPRTVNIEKIQVLSLKEMFEKVENPVCPECKKHMKSKGKGQGYFCKSCKTVSFDVKMKKRKRTISCGFYEVAMCARRHLSKPLKRMDTTIY